MSSNNMNNPGPSTSLTEQSTAPVSNFPVSTDIGNLMDEQFYEAAAWHAFEDGGLAEAPMALAAYTNDQQQYCIQEG